jgi:hypothetical protein
MAFAIAAATAALAMCLLYMGWRTHSWWGPLFAAVPALAATGLVRGLDWGRQVASLTWVPFAFWMGGALFGYLDGFAAWLKVPAICVAVCAVLAPLVVIGWRKQYFRHALW